jgi:hypothetical protein
LTTSAKGIELIAEGSRPPSVGVCSGEPELAFDEEATDSGACCLPAPMPDNR